MKKTKLFISISALCFTLAVLLFGVYAANQVNYSISGQITYTVDDAYVNVSTSIYRCKTKMSDIETLDLIDDATEDITTITSDSTNFAPVVTNQGAYNSINSGSGSYDFSDLDLAFSTHSGSEAYAYYFIIHVETQGDSPDVWVAIDDEIEYYYDEDGDWYPFNEYTSFYNSAYLSDVDNNGANFIVAITLTDFTHSISEDLGSVSFGLRIGTGDIATSEWNLGKLDQEALAQGIAQKASDEMDVGIIVIPATYTPEVSESNNPFVQNEAVEPVEITEIADYGFADGNEDDGTEMWWFFAREIYLPEGIETIGDYALSSTVGMYRVNIPSTVTSLGEGCLECSYWLPRLDLSGATLLTTIPDYFMGWSCVDLSLKLPNTITSIGESAFADVYIVNTNFTLPTSLQTIGDYAFNASEISSALTIPANVIEIGEYAFCSNNFTSLSLPQGLTTIGEQAFAYNNLTSITVANGSVYFKSPSNSSLIRTKVYDEENEEWDDDNTLILGATTLTSLPTVSPAITAIGPYALAGCKNLTTLDLTGVESVGDSAFCDCTGLTSVTIPDSVTEMGSNIFNGCNNITTAEINSQTTPSFNNCEKLTEVTFGEHVETISDIAFYNCTSLTTVNWGDNIDTIESYAFYNTALTSVELPDGLTKIDSYAFQNCQQLKNIIIPNSVINIETSAFDNCSNLTSAEIDMTTTPTLYITSLRSLKLGTHVTTVSAASFAGSNLLTSLTISNSVENIGNNAFAGCIELSTVEFGTGLKTIGNGAFAGCSLTSLNLPSGLTKIGNSAFSGCTGLTDVIIPDSVTVLMSQAFAGCTEIVSLTLPYVAITDDSGNVETGFDLLGSNSIRSQLKLRDVNITGNGSIKIVQGAAFKDLPLLETVVIGDGITEIKAWSFKNCLNLTSLTIGENVETFSDTCYSGAVSLEIIINKSNKLSKSVYLPNLDGYYWVKDGSGSSVTTMQTAGTYRRVLNVEP